MFVGDHRYLQAIDVGLGKIHSDPMQQSQNLIDERFLLSGLLHDEVTSTLLRNLDESIAGHILYTYTAFRMLTT